MPPSDAGPQVREADPSLGGTPVDQSARVPQVTVIPTADDTIEDLRRQMAELETSSAAERERAETERRAREDAQRQARDAESRVAEANRKVRDVETTSARSTAEAQLDSVKNALTAHQSKMAALQAEHETALETGEFKTASKLQAEMAVTGARIVQLESGQAELETRVKEPPAGRAVDDGQQQPPASGDDRREAFIRQQPPRVQDWLRTDKGTRFFTDGAFQEKVAAAARFATSVRGLSIDSQDYIDYIEEQVGLREPPAREQQQQPSRQAASGGRDANDGRVITAPAGGSTGGAVRSRADGSTEVYLTAGEKEQARRDGVSEVEWARAKAALLDEGLIGPNARTR